MRKRGTERLPDLPKTTQPARDRTRIRTQEVCVCVCDPHQGHLWEGRSKGVGGGGCIDVAAKAADHILDLRS